MELYVVHKLRKRIAFHENICCDVTESNNLLCNVYDF